MPAGDGGGLEIGYMCGSICTAEGPDLAGRLALLTSVILLSVLR